MNDTGFDIEIIQRRQDLRLALTAGVSDLRLGGLDEREHLLPLCRIEMQLPAQPPGDLLRGKRGLTVQHAIGDAWLPTARIRNAPAVIPSTNTTTTPRIAFQFFMLFSTQTGPPNAASPPAPSAASAARLGLHIVGPHAGDDDNGRKHGHESPGEGRPRRRLFPVLAQAASSRVSKPYSAREVSGARPARGLKQLVQLFIVHGSPPEFS
jgi:hypothetical protein